MYISMTAAILLWIAPPDFTDFDWSTIISSAPVIFTGASFFIAMFFYQLRLDDKLDGRLKESAIFGGWIGNYEERSPLLRAVAMMNVFLNPWYSTDWTSLDDDCETALNSVIESELVQDNLWELKLSLATAITIAIAFAKYMSLINPTWAALAILAGLVIIAATVLRRETRNLPSKVQRLAILRYMTDSTEGAISRLGTIDNEIVNPICDWMKRLSEDSKSLTALVEESRWELFETKLRLAIRFLENELYSDELSKYIEKELTNSFIAVFIRSSEPQIRYSDSEIEELERHVEAIRENLIIAYDGFPPDWLVPWISLKSIQELVELFGAFNVNYIDTDTMNRLGSYFAWGDRTILTAFLEKVFQHSSTPILTPYIKKSIYKYFNDPSIPEAAKESRIIAEFIFRNCREYFNIEEMEPHVVKSMINLIQNIDEDSMVYLEGMLLKVALKGETNYISRYEVIKNLRIFERLGLDKTKQKISRINLQSEIIKSISKTHNLLDLLDGIPEKLLSEKDVSKAIENRVEDIAVAVSSQYRSLKQIADNRNIVFLSQFQEVRDALVTRIRKQGAPFYGLDVLSLNITKSKYNEIQEAIEIQIERLSNDIDSYEIDEDIIDQIKEIDWLIKVNRIAKSIDRFERRSLRESQLTRGARAIALISMSIGVFLMMSGTLGFPLVPLEVVMTPIFIALFAIYFTEVYPYYMRTLERLRNRRRQRKESLLEKSLEKTPLIANEEIVA